MGWKNEKQEEEEEEEEYREKRNKSVRQYDIIWYSMILIHVT